MLHAVKLVYSHIRGWHCAEAVLSGSLEARDLADAVLIFCVTEVITRNHNTTECIQNNIKGCYKVVVSPFRDMGAYTNVEGARTRARPHL